MTKRRTYEIRTRTRRSSSCAGLLADTPIPPLPIRSLRRQSSPPPNHDHRQSGHRSAGQCRHPLFRWRSATPGARPRNAAPCNGHVRGVLHPVLVARLPPPDQAHHPGHCLPAVLQRQVLEEAAGSRRDLRAHPDQPNDEGKGREEDVDLRPAVSRTSGEGQYSICSNASDFHSLTLSNPILIISAASPPGMIHSTKVTIDRHWFSCLDLSLALSRP